MSIMIRSRPVPPLPSSSIIIMSAYGEKLEDLLYHMMTEVCFMSRGSVGEDSEGHVIIHLPLSKDDADMAPLAHELKADEVWMTFDMSLNQFKELLT